MLQPPPPRESFDVGALDSEGKERYLSSLGKFFAFLRSLNFCLGCVSVVRLLERKLDKLQGANKRAITSKDIMASLSEARDDHLRQGTYDSTSKDDKHHHHHHTHADVWEATPTFSSPNQCESGGGGESAEYFVPVEPQGSCCRCWPCFRTRDPESPFPMQLDEERGGGGGGGGGGRHNSLRDSLRQSGHSRDVGYSVHQGISGLGPALRQSPSRGVREEHASSGPLQSADKIRHLVGLGKPKGNHEEERMLLLDQDEEN